MQSLVIDIWGLPVTVNKMLLVPVFCSSGRHVYLGMAISYT